MTLHEKCFSPVWVFKWLLKWLFRKNDIGHWSHEKSFSPVWVFIWVLKWLFRKNDEVTAAQHFYKTINLCKSAVSIFTACCLFKYFIWFDLKLTLIFTFCVILCSSHIFLLLLLLFLLQFFKKYLSVYLYYWLQT